MADSYEVRQTWPSDGCEERGVFICAFARKHYPNIDDAALVTEIFGSALGSRFNQFLVKGREADLLSEARLIQAQREAEKK